MYGRDTCILLASSVCDTPSSFIRLSIRLKNAEPILSIAFIPFNQPSRHPQFLQPTLLTSRRTRPDAIFHLRHSILPLSTSFAPPHHAIPSKYKPFIKIALMCFRRLRHHCYAVMTVPKPLAWLCVTTNGNLCRARYFANTELDGWRYMLPNPAEITLYADIVKNSSLKFPFEP